MSLASTLYPGNPNRNLLIVHGYTGSQEDFAHVIGPLAETVTVTTVDLPGHGLSPRFDTYSYALATGELAAFIEASLPIPVDVLGHSMGGRIVLELAVRRPDLIRSLVLMDTWGDTPDRDEYGAELEAMFSLPDEQIPAALDALDRDTGERALIIATWGEQWLEAHHAQNRNRLDPKALVDYGRPVFTAEPGIITEAATLTVPTTVLVGSNDTPMLAASDRLAAAIQNARLVRIDGGYHSPQLTHAAEWRDAIEDHLTLS